MSLWINGTYVYQAGTPTDFDAAKLSNDIGAHRDVQLRLVFGRGEDAIRFWTCDQSAEYVWRNADCIT